MVKTRDHMRVIIIRSMYECITAHSLDWMFETRQNKAYNEEPESLNMNRVVPAIAIIAEKARTKASSRLKYRANITAG